MLHRELIFDVRSFESFLKACEPNLSRVLIDLDGFLCNRAHELTDLGGVHDIRPDHAHYSEAGARALAGWVMPIVLGRTRPPPYASN